MTAVVEMARITAQPGRVAELEAGLRQGMLVIRRAQGCNGVTLRRCVEEPEVLLLEIEWATLDDHIVTFRNGPLFPEYRSHIAGLFVEPVDVRHFTTLEQA